MMNQEVGALAPLDTVVPTEGVGASVPVAETAANGATSPAAEATPEPVVEPEAPTVSAADPLWHARAGRKGAHRVHQLIREGRLYEQEHGLKRGRQRLRQLIELGKLYEQEHGLRPAKKSSRRLSRMGREELVATLLQCLVRIARPSFRAELLRLAETLQKNTDGPAA